MQMGSKLHSWIIHDDKGWLKWETLFIAAFCSLIISFHVQDGKDLLDIFPKSPDGMCFLKGLRSVIPNANHKGERQREKSLKFSWKR